MKTYSEPRHRAGFFYAQIKGVDMLNIILERFAYLPTCTLGRLKLPEFDIFTLERPWLGNEAFRSCIPEGAYECEPYSGEKFKDVYILRDVPERTAILIHAANEPQEIQGCIAPGLSLHADNGGVYSSRSALNEIKKQLAYKPFRLLITNFMPEYP